MISDIMSDEEDERNRMIVEVGKVSYEALIKGSERIKPGVSYLDVANFIEDYTRSKGFDIAFPVNISANEQAAHYTPAYEDDKVFNEKDVIKLDFGAAKDGYLGDCAVTVDLSGEYSDLVDATKEALENAIATVKAGVEVGKIGKVIEETITSKGFIPVKNLGGHGVNKHELHAEPFIPNYGDNDTTKLEEGKVIAIEPFATTKFSRGLITESDILQIFGYVSNNPTRLPNARKILSEIEENYNSEPFAARWLGDKVKSKFDLYSGINELIRNGSIEPYPVLVEMKNGIVAQTELEMLVEKDSCKILTKL